MLAMGHAQQVQHVDALVLSFDQQALGFGHLQQLVACNASRAERGGSVAAVREMAGRFRPARQVEGRVPGGRLRGPLSPAASQVSLAPTRTTMSTMPDPIATAMASSDSAMKLQRGPAQ